MRFSIMHSLWMHKEMNMPAVYVQLNVGYCLCCSLFYFIFWHVRRISTILTGSEGYLTFSPVEPVGVYPTLVNYFLQN